MYELVGKSRDEAPDARGEERLRMGHKVHELIQEVLPKIQLEGHTVEVLIEPPCPPDDPMLLEMELGGTPDAVMLIYSQEGALQYRIVLELKSINNAGYSWVLLNGPIPAHVKQATIYSKRHDAPVMGIWYYNKDTHEQHLEWVRFDPNLLDETLDTVRTWRQLAIDGKLPPREETYFVCRSCAYRRHCNPEILKQKYAPYLPGAAQLLRKKAISHG